MRLALRLLALLLRERDREMLIGDLVEEHALVASASGARCARRWLLGQVWHSVAPVLWADFGRGVWLKAMGAVLAGYATVAVLVMAGEIVLAKLLAENGTMYPVLSLAAGVSAALLGGYLAAWMRPRAATGLAILVALMGIASLAVTGDAAPLWYQIALIVAGPAAALAGGRLRKRRRA